MHWTEFKGFPGLSMTLCDASRCWHFPVCHAVLCSSHIFLLKKYLICVTNWFSAIIVMCCHWGSNMAILSIFEHMVRSSCLVYFIACNGITFFRQRVFYSDFPDHIWPILLTHSQQGVGHLDCPWGNEYNEAGGVMHFYEFWEFYMCGYCGTSHNKLNSSNNCCSCVIPLLCEAIFFIEINWSIINSFQPPLKTTHRIIFYWF